jgi:formylglycine-generating enzyme required for sulfatase activity
MDCCKHNIGIFLIVVSLVVTLVSGCAAPAEQPAATATQLASTMPATATATEAPAAATSTAEAAVLALAEAGVTRNIDWTPYTQDVNGVLMALVPAGCFQMGAVAGNGDERPVHMVCFDEPFWIDVYEVTNEQYGSTGCADFSPDPDQPRNCVDWADALAHCESRGARLPTEAEWEYAARGPDGLVYSWGNEFIESNAVWGYNSDREPAPVGSIPEGVSWIGAYDMSGNVWEWVNDWHSGLYYGTLADGVVNPQGPRGGTYHVLRGGSFLYDGADALRATYRGGIWPNPELVDDGFRCALSYGQ